MTVSELISFLQTQPQDLTVVYSCYSEYVVLVPEAIDVQELCLERPDGWVHDKRPDKASKPYLAFPGN